MASTDPKIAALAVLRERFSAETELNNGATVVTFDQAVQPWLTTQQSDGSWADIDYASGHLKDWAATEHLTRLLHVVQAWHQPASPVHGNPVYLAAALRGLDAWYAKAPVNPNWWWNQIGAPLLLGDILLPLKGHCDSSYITRAVPAFTCHLPAWRFTGQNLVWVAGIEIRHGVLTDDTALVSQGFTLIAREVRLCPAEEGIQPDMSFFQHGRLLYSGGYGQGFAADVSRFAWLGSGTPYAWPSHVLDLLVRYLLDGSRWMVRGNTFEYGADGREITRQGHSTARFLQGARYMVRLEHPRRPEFQTLAETVAHAGRSWVTGNRHFWCADLMVQHRPAYYLSVRLPSSRIENADMPCCGGEGRLCHHMAEGATFILCDGDEYRDVFPVWNWRQIPGTTVIQETGELPPDKLRPLHLPRDFRLCPENVKLLLP